MHEQAVLFIFAEKLTSFFLSILLSFGAFGGAPAVKVRVALPMLSLTGADCTGGLTASVPFASGLVRFNRISFSYAASAPVRAAFRQCRDTIQS